LFLSPVTSGRLNSLPVSFLLCSFFSLSFKLLCVSSSAYIFHIASSRHCPIPRR
jgi:hypothetical protein